MAEYFEMGHHTFYVWLSYGVSFALFFGLAFFCFDGRAKAKTSTEKRIRRLLKQKRESK